MRIFLDRSHWAPPGEILAHVYVSLCNDTPEFYSHSFIYKVPSGHDGEIIVYTSESDAASGVNGSSYRFDLEKCNNEKCKKASAGCQEIKNKPNRLLVANVYHTKPKQNALQDFGSALFKALFSKVTENLLRATDARNEYGQIFLELNEQDLDAIPWEYAKDGSSFLVHDRKFTRLLAQEGKSPLDPLPELPLHIVVVAPDPLDLTDKGYADLRLGDQFQCLIDEFHGENIDVMLERVLPATVNKVNSLIAKPDNPRAPVLHFMGHSVAHDNGRGLLFEDRDTFTCKIVRTQSLIKVPRSLRLAFLSACDSREVARDLAQNGVRHTIGSYCDLPDDVARKFEAQYYWYLSYGLSVDDAMWQSRMDNNTSKDLRQNDYLAGAIILYSTTCHTDDSKFSPKFGELKIEHNMCANNLDAIRSEKLFVGRKVQLAELNTFLRRMATRRSVSADVCTITGICGQGKTTLAMKAARRNSHFFPGGIFVWHFDDKPISFRDYLRKLAQVLFPNLSRGDTQNCAEEVGILKDAIPNNIKASTLLILDHADILTRAKVKGDALDLVTWLKAIISWEDIPVKILATSLEPLKWSGETSVKLDGFIGSDIDSGIELFLRKLDEKARETMMKQKKQLLRNIVIGVDGHPWSLIHLSRITGDKLPEDLAHKSYRTILANNDHYSKSLRDQFEPVLNTFPKQWRLLLYICSLFAIPVGKEKLAHVREFFDNDILPDDSDIVQLRHGGWLIEEGDDNYRCHAAIWVIAKDFHSDFKLRIPKTNIGATQAVELLHKSLSGARWTPLHLASNNGQIDLVKLLLNYGADANQKCDDGRAPLHLAAQSGHVEMVKLLATFGADVNAESSDGWSPLQYAEQNGHDEVVKFLVTPRANWTTFRDPYGQEVESNEDENKEYENEEYESEEDEYEEAGKGADIEFSDTLCIEGFALTLNNEEHFSLYLSSKSVPPPNVNNNNPWYPEVQNQNYGNSSSNQVNIGRPYDDPNPYQHAQRLPEKDAYNVSRGRCNMCQCMRYTNRVDGLQCEYCSHYPINHENLSRNPGSDVNAKSSNDRSPLHLGEASCIYFHKHNAEYYEFTNFQEGYPIMSYGVMWPTSEHLFQAMKFQSVPKIQEKVRKARSPQDAFNIARENSQYQIPNWKDINIDVMYQVLMLKFTQHLRLKKMLLDTGDAVLVHTVNDAFWGDGGDGRGRNELGKCLMRVREELKRV